MKIKKAGLLTRIVIIALVLYSAISLIILGARTETIRRDRERLQSRADELSRENEGLQYEIDHSNDPAVIEEVARNKLGLVKPGEKIFIDAGN